ncbi:hypothetical protein [Serratia marcescens]|uniref:hypothetical protein n=1 Tax=Serratia marcescens TaxID=615 RepID=UPI0013DA0364|nr:hypothetical protein [Serratia marcescens]
MTLTTEQLRARAKFWREKAVEVKWESVSIAQGMLQNADAFDELAANREAQSVEIGKRSVFTCSSCGAQGLDEPLESRCHCMGDGAHWVESALYTAPPAPAVPSEATPENIENLLADITLFFTAGRLSHGGAVMFAEVWNACRSAMLENIDKPAPQLDSVVTRHADQPVSGGYKLVPIELTDRMIDAFNETPPRTLSIEDLWRALLAAAPEGGN